ncbi:MAG: hypothetical protein IMW98_07640 [Firmicutes bacterium]|nr:hypothetical protein [Bacillota bacterium]
MGDRHAEVGILHRIDPSIPPDREIAVEHPAEIVVLIDGGMRAVAAAIGEGARRGAGPAEGLPVRTGAWAPRAWVPDGARAEVRIAREGFALPPDVLPGDRLVVVRVGTMPHDGIGLRGGRLVRARRGEAVDGFVAGLMRPLGAGRPDPGESMVKD